jgi:hypothetical protein
MTKAVTILAGITILLASVEASDAQIKNANPLVREERFVVVSGVRELWQLAWATKPKSLCAPENIEDAISCPCAGFAYGEQGRLLLIRWRNGKKIEQMDLGHVFDLVQGQDQDAMSPPPSDDAPGIAALQRWPLYDSDFQRSGLADAAIVKEIRKRPQTQVMQFVDYNRDGMVTKFILQVGTEPCGKTDFVAIGLTADEPHLHVLGSSVFSGRPLILSLGEWRALSNGPGKHVVQTDACGDHGSETYADAIVSASNGKIHVIDRFFQCTSDDKPGRLTQESER